jgi:hypothetical protein
MMKAISLWQPWASLVVLGAKQIETRSWSTRYRGPLLIHAAKRKSFGELADLGDHWKACGIDVRSALNIPKELNLWRDICNWLPYGALIGQVDLVDCMSVEGLVEDLTEQEEQFGNYAPGRFGWVFENPVAFDTPIPYRGYQGLFDAWL